MSYMLKSVPAYLVKEFINRSGYTVTHNDAVSAWAAFLKADGGTGSRIPELELTWLASKGAVGNNIVDCWGSLLDQRGYSGSLNNQILSFASSGTSDAAPTAPSGLSGVVGAAGSGEITVSWTDNSNNEDSFTLQRKAEVGGTFATINSPAAGVTSYLDTGLTAGTNYYYRIRANNEGGSSAWSSEAGPYTPTAAGGFSDNFDRADSTTTLGASWTVSAGSTWGISTNKAYLVAFDAGATEFAWAESSLSDGTVSAVMTTGDAFWGLLFRYSDASNYWFVENQSGTLSLNKVVAGTTTNVATGTGAPANGDTISVVLSGSSITVKIGATTDITATDSHNSTATKHGLHWSDYISGTGTERWDTFSVA